MSPIVPLLGVAIAVMGAWKGDQELNRKIASLPVQGTSAFLPATQPAGGTGLENLYPLVRAAHAEEGGLPPVATEAALSGLDAAFLPPPPPPEEKDKEGVPEQPEIIYVSCKDTWLRSLSVDAVATHGAVINGMFYAIGEPVAGASQGPAPAAVTPLLMPPSAGGVGGLPELPPVAMAAGPQYIKAGQPTLTAIKGEYVRISCAGSNGHAGGSFSIPDEPAAAAGAGVSRPNGLAAPKRNSRKNKKRN